MSHRPTNITKSIHVINVLLILLYNLHFIFHCFPDGFVSKRQDTDNPWHPSAFPCNLYDNKPLCRNGGTGLKVYRTRIGLICVCMCHGNFTGPECLHPADDNKVASKRGIKGMSRFWKAK